MILILLFVLLGIGQGIESYAAGEDAVKKWNMPFHAETKGPLPQIEGVVIPFHSPFVYESRMNDPENEKYFNEKQDYNPWRSCAFKDANDKWPSSSSKPYVSAQSVFDKMEPTKGAVMLPDFKDATDKWVSDFKDKICHGKQPKFSIFMQDFSSPKGFFELGGEYCPLFVDKETNAKKTPAITNFFGETIPGKRFCTPWENLSHDWGSENQIFVKYKIKSSNNNNVAVRENIRLCLLGLVTQGILSQDFIQSGIKYQGKDLECVYPSIKDKIVNSQKALWEVLDRINKNYTGYPESLKTTKNKAPLPPISMDYCPKHYRDVTANISTTLENLVKDRDLSTSSVKEFYSVGSAKIDIEAPKYGMHYFKSGCIHPVSIADNEPFIFKFRDNISKLTNGQCSDIKNSILNNFNTLKLNNNDSTVSIAGLTLMSSSSTLDNTLKDTTEFHYPKNFSRLSELRNAEVEKCIFELLNDSSNAFKDLKVAFREFKDSTGSEGEKIKRIAYGTNEDGTTGECAYACDVNEVGYPKKCKEIVRDFENKTAILDTYQFSTFAVKFNIKRKAPKASAHYIGAAQRCFRVTLSCSR